MQRCWQTSAGVKRGTSASGGKWRDVSVCMELSWEVPRKPFISDLC